MRFHDWVWGYLGTGDSFTRWAVLLFYGAGGGVLVVIAVLLAARIGLRTLMNIE